MVTMDSSGTGSTTIVFGIGLHLIVAGFTYSSGTQIRSM